MAENLELLKKLDFTLDSEQERISYFQKSKGMFAAFIWVLTVVVSASCVTLLRRQVPDFELNVARCGTAFLVAAIILIGKLKIFTKS